jgi:hypothetical protein
MFVQKNAVVPNNQFHAINSNTMPLQHKFTNNGPIKDFNEHLDRCHQVHITDRIHLLVVLRGEPATGVMLLTVNIVLLRNCHRRVAESLDIATAMKRLYSLSLSAKFDHKDQLLGMIFMIIEVAVIAEVTQILAIAVVVAVVVVHWHDSYDRDYNRSYQQQEYEEFLKWKNRRN